MMKFESAWGIGDHVQVLGQPGRVKAVTFTSSKVLYDVDLNEGGETMQHIDSTYIAVLPR